MSVIELAMSFIAVVAIMVAIRERRSARHLKVVNGYLKDRVRKANRLSHRRQQKWTPETVSSDEWRKEHLLLPQGEQVVPMPESLKGLQYWEVELIASGAMTRSA